MYDTQPEEFDNDLESQVIENNGFLEDLNIIKRKSMLLTAENLIWIYWCTSFNQQMHLVHRNKGFN